jgi:hypothetical protein
MPVHNAVMASTKCPALLFDLPPKDFKTMIKWCRETFGKSRGFRDSKWYVENDSDLLVYRRGIMIENNEDSVFALLTWGD